jgi:hypothetical protein
MLKQRSGEKELILNGEHINNLELRGKDSMQNKKNFANIKNA